MASRPLLSAALRHNLIANNGNMTTLRPLTPGCRLLTISSDKRAQAKTSKTKLVKPKKTGDKAVSLTSAKVASLFQCPKCSFCADDKQKIKQHLKRDHKSPPYACPHCQEGFTNFKNLNKHIQSSHQGEAILKEPYLSVKSDTSTKPEKATSGSALLAKKFKESLKEVEMLPKGTSKLIVSKKSTSAASVSKTQTASKEETPVKPVHETLHKMITKRSLEPRDIPWPKEKYILTIYPLKTDLGVGDFVQNQTRLQDEPESVEQAARVPDKNSHEFRTMQDDFGSMAQEWMHKAGESVRGLFKTIFSQFSGTK